MKRNRAFWEGGQFAASYGFAKSVPLGEPGGDAKAAAVVWNSKLDAVREAKKRGVEPSPQSRYQPGSLGSFYERFQKTEAWGQMEKRTREDYHRAWPYIEKRFSDRVISKITSEDSERFHVDIHPVHKNRRDVEGKLKLGWNTAHRVLKVWRALLTALVDYKLLAPPAPVGRVTNPRPPGRQALWLFSEVADLVNAAEALELWGMAMAIRIAWDAMLSPIDALQLPIGGFRQVVEEVRTTRQKSKRKVFASISPETAAAGVAYLARLEAAGIKIDPEAPLIRNSALKPYDGPHAKKYFERDFRAARAKAFPGDVRQMLDLRRSAITEGRMGGASLDDLGASAANNLATDQTLQSTYALAASKNVQAARQAGRAKLASRPTDFGTSE